MLCNTKNVVKKICKNCFIKQYCHFLAIATKKREIGNDTTNQQSIFNFSGKTQKKQLKKMKKTPENSMATKHLTINKKQKIEKILKEPDQSNRQLSSTTVTNTKETD